MCMAAVVSCACPPIREALTAIFLSFAKCEGETPMDERPYVATGTMLVLKSFLADLSIVPNMWSLLDLVWALAILALRSLVPLLAAAVVSMPRSLMEVDGVTGI